VPIGSVAYSSFGTNKTPVAGTIYISDIYVVRNTTLTGIGLLNGSTAGGTNTVIYALYNAQGKLIANTDLSGTSTSGANAFQQIAFTSAVNVDAGQYFVAVQRNGTTDTLRTVAADTFVDVVSTSVAGVFGTIPSSITVPTSFSADNGPIVYVY